ncbi:transposase [Streptomyces sp. NPDC056647]|uniref:transposase n=1 Tax=unclassified Streptomyces TaxID=2593676 RepID=UPI003697F22C
MESFLPSGGACGGRWSDHRRVINGVLHRVRTGVRWRVLLERFGPWETVCKRIVAGPLVEPGRCRCRASRQPRMPRAGSTGTCPWTRQRCAGPSVRRRRGESAFGSRSSKGAGRESKAAGPVLRKLAARLEEVVRPANARDVPAAAPPPGSTSSPKDGAGPSLSS